MDQLHPPRPVLIPLTNGMSAIVDADLAASLAPYTWHPVKRRRCFYAYAAIHPTCPRTQTSMSRLVANTPSNLVCHHRNRNPLDNRRANLLNMPRHEHKLLHRNNSLLIKFEHTTRGAPSSAPK